MAAATRVDMAAWEPDMRIARVMKSDLLAEVKVGMAKQEAVKDPRTGSMRGTEFYMFILI